MAVWRTIPSWFDLKNYSALASYSAVQWTNELFARGISFQTLTEAENLSTQNDLDHAKYVFDHIKKYALINEERMLSTEVTPYIPLGTYRKTRAAVENISELDAYEFFLGSHLRKEIEADWFRLGSWDQNTVEDRKAIMSKYSHPIAKVVDYNKHYVQVDINASDEQLLFEFKEWLSETRGNAKKFVKRQFAKPDFDDWHLSRLLPYWDLTSIAAIENATIPFHILGQALFPYEYGVDLTERVRKVTKKKCQTLFSPAVIWALDAQATSEELKVEQYTEQKIPE